jgi:hypothetical protein
MAIDHLHKMVFNENIGVAYFSDARGLDCRGSGWIVMLEFVHG